MIFNNFFEFFFISYNMTTAVSTVVESNVPRHKLTFLPPRQPGARIMVSPGDSYPADASKIGVNLNADTFLWPLSSDLTFRWYVNDILVPGQETETCYVEVDPGTHSVRVEVEEATLGLVIDQTHPLKLPVLPQS